MATGSGNSNVNSNSSSGSNSSKRSSSNSNSGIENIEFQSMLFDFYGSLLNEGQNEVMALYHEDNLSLSEIAEDLGMSRQAVHYTLKRAEKALNGYEAKLGLVNGYLRNQKLASRARQIIEDMDALAGSRAGEELLGIIDKITE